MDFHGLTRKELQTLCKKNKIPANTTNVAMADALASLQQVEGLDEFSNPAEPDAQQFQEEKVVGTPDTHRTARRTSSRRRAVKEEPESTRVSTRLQRGGSREEKTEGVEQDNKNVNVPVTPAMPPSRSRRGAPAVSTRRKKEALLLEDEDNGEHQGKPTTDVPKTPAAPSSRTRNSRSKIETPNATSVQRAYSTRRSVRLLEKNLGKMSLTDSEDMGHVKIDDVTEEMSSVSQQTQDSAETEEMSNDSQRRLLKIDDVTEEISNVSQQTKDSAEAEGASFQTESTVVPEKTDEVESDERNNDHDEGQLQDSDTQLQIGSMAENDLVAASLPTVVPEKTDEMESDEMNNDHEGQLQDLDTQLQIGSMAENDVVAGSLPTVSTVVPEKTNDMEKNKSHDSDSEVELGSGSENDVGLASLQAEPQERLGKINDLEAEPEPHDSNIKPEVSSEAYCDQSFVDLNTSIEKATDANNETGSGFSFETELEDPCDSAELEDSCDSAEPEEQKWQETNLEAPEDAYMEVKLNDSANLEAPEQDVTITSVEASADAPMEVSAQDIAGFHPMSSASNDTAGLKEFMECNTDVNQGSGDGDYQDKNNEIEYLKVADGNDIQNVEAEINNLAGPEGVLCSAGEPKELDAKSEHWEESGADIMGKTVHASDNDIAVASFVLLEKEEETSFENSNSAMEACVYSSADVSLDAENVTFGTVLKSDDEKDKSENLEPKTLSQESKEHVAAEETQQLLVDSAELSGENCVYSCAVIPEEIAFPIQESHVSAEYMNESANIKASADNIDGVRFSTVTIDTINQQKTSDIPTQSIGIDFKGRSEPKVENQTVQNISVMKENLSHDELQKKTMGELKKLFKKLTLGDKLNSKTNTFGKEVERTRTALKALPDNRMTVGEGLNDG